MFSVAENYNCCTAGCMSVLIGVIRALLVLNTYQGTRYVIFNTLYYQ